MHSKHYAGNNPIRFSDVKPWRVKVEGSTRCRLIDGKTASNALRIDGINACAAEGNDLLFRCSARMLVHRMDRKGYDAEITS